MVALEIRWMRMPAQRAPSLLPGSETWRSTTIMRSSFSKVAWNETSLTRLTMSRALRGVPGRSTGFTCTRIVSLDAHSRIKGVMVGLPGVAAVPIGLAVDLDSLKHSWQAGGGEQDLRRQFNIAENVPAPGVHIGGGDEQLRRRLGDSPEVDAVSQDFAQRVGATRIEVVGREDARH